MARRLPGRRPGEYRSRQPVREPYDVVLIVCEGAKTEPFYFEGLKRAWRLSSANVHVRHAGATDPPSLVAYSLEELRTGDYDRAFCVFDRDTHAGFNPALRQIAESVEGRAGKLAAIVSWPCFEIWVLLHFAMTTRAFTATGGRSACEEVIREVVRHFSGYAKGRRDAFEFLAARLDDALLNASRLSQHNRQTSSRNSSTTVHTLITYLRELRAERQPLPPS
jgi:hypothetical protein